MILFLGQNPMPSETADRPLVGNTLQTWLRCMGIDESDVVFATASRKRGRVTWKDYDAGYVAAIAESCQKHVALGAYASGVLERLGIRHFTLPLPAGPDHKPNNPDELSHLLQLCRTYIRGRQS